MANKINEEAEENQLDDNIDYSVDGIEAEAQADVTEFADNNETTPGADSPAEETVIDNTAEETIVDDTATQKTTNVSVEEPIQQAPPESFKVMKFEDFIKSSDE